MVAAAVGRDPREGESLARAGDRELRDLSGVLRARAWARTPLKTLELKVWALVRVHVLTINDELARRDAAWMGPHEGSLGFTVGAVQEAMEPAYAGPLLALWGLYNWYPRNSARQRCNKG